MLVLEVMVSWPPVRQPAPLPGWAVSLGAFLAATSLLQVWYPQIFTLTTSKTIFPGLVHNKKKLRELSKLSYII
jgi:hypothetical protein